ncbi:MAG TPA: hypothetical protein VGK45_12690, partial [Thermoanaerobaculia bacterium]
MTTQFQFTEPQTAILAACPRPRVTACITTGVFATDGFATVGFATADFATADFATADFATVSFVAGAPAGAEWPPAAAGIAASVRRPDSVTERPASGYPAGRVLTDSVRVELGGSASGNAGFGMAGSAATGNGATGNGMTSSKQQDKQHLTTRREPVT